MIQLTKNQRYRNHPLDTKTILRPFADRKKFRLNEVLADHEIHVPLELLTLWRAYNNMRTVNSYRWDQNIRSEYILCYNFIINSNVPLILLSPATSLNLRHYVRNFLGPIYDFVPITFPSGIKQTMFMDVHNQLGKGHNALYLSQPGHNVYQFMFPNIESWLLERTKFLKLGYYRIHNDFITNELNVRQIYNDYRLGICSFDEINSNFPFTSFT